MNADLLKELLWSAKELHAGLERNLVDLERQGDDPELLDDIYRSFHSLKGAAGLVGLPLFEIVTHECESVLGTWRNHPKMVDDNGIQLMIMGVDLLGSLIANLEQHRDEGSVDISTFVVETSAYAELLKAEIPIAVEPGRDDTDSRHPDPMANAQPEGIGTAKHESDHESGADRASDRDEASAKPEQPPSTNPSQESCEFHPVPAMEAPAGGRRTSTTNRTRTTGGPQTSTGSRGSEASVRVSVDLLDRLMNQVGELVLARNQVIQAVATSGDSTLQGTTRVLDQVTSELQESIMQTRMQPIGVITDKFPRIVRDLARQLDKEVDLVIEGRETELDRTVVEAVRDPFTHILRNCIDHGLETADDRQNKGKSRSGTVTIRAYHESGQVIVEVSDDGRGIDVARVKAKAVERGLLSEADAERMPDGEAFNLICHPGLSTAEQVTNISGRGVGMDVVRSNIEHIGGSLDIQSVFGRGTTVRIKIPLTLAIIPALMVGLGDRMFGIPQVNLVELVSLDSVEDGIEAIREAQVMRLRERLLTVVSLDRLLDLELSADPILDPETDESAGADPRAGGYIVVVAAGDHHFGLMVEHIYDTEEIVVKPLSKHLSSVEQLAGATIRGDGTVSLILDVAGIARSHQLQGSGEHVATGKDHEVGLATTTVMEDDFIVFRTTTDAQFAIPLQLVSRIERFDSTQLTRINGKLAVNRGQRVLPTLLMDEFLAESNNRFPSDDSFYSIIVSSGDGVGFLADQLVDITSIPPHVISHECDFDMADMASGVAVIEGIPTLLLDVYRIIDRSFPNSHDSRQAKCANGHSPRVLFAEDAPFFQGVVANYLREAGYEIKVCADGAEAWSLLNDLHDQRFDLILTDLEMPRMTGWELIENVRGLPDYRQTPIIALSSLTDEDSRQRALTSGANDYRVKLNRDELLTAMNEALN